MAELGRPSALLPLIKCSTCGVDIEITSLTEHICASASNSEPTLAPSFYQSHIPDSFEHPLPAVPLDSERSLANRSGQALQHTGGYMNASPSNPSGFLRPGRTTPSQIDPTSANRPFFASAPLAPENVYSGHNIAVSPVAQPLAPQSTLASQPIERDAMSTFQAAAAPSPQQSLNPTNSPFRTRQTQEMRRPAFLNLHKALPTPELTMGPLSPRMNGGADLLKRMATIKPGPFASTPTRLAERSPSQPVISTTSTTSELKSSPPRPGFLTRSPFSSPAVLSPPSQMEQQSTSNDEIIGPTDTTPRLSPVRPERPAEDIDQFLEQLQNESSPPAPSALRQSSTTEQEEERIVERILTFDANPVSGLPHPPQSAMFPPTSDPRGWISKDIPERPGTSLGNTTMEDSRGTANPEMLGEKRPSLKPAPTLRTQIGRQVSNKSIQSEASHAPSFSASTVASSSFSAVSEASSQSSWSSVASPALDRSSSGASGLRKQSVPAIPTRPTTADGGNNHSQEPAMQTPLPAPSIHLPTLLPPTPAPYVHPDSPLDPAIQWGGPLKPPFLRELSTETVSTVSSTGVATSDTSPATPSPEPQRSLPAMAPTTPQTPTGLPNPVASEQKAANLLSPTAGQKSKGTCRGCKQAIFGKSVKAADGRLTGRYHRECFKCTTCSSQFADSSFYVFGNSPYCAFHYHQLNHSLCRRCNRGIEGAYMETERKEKFHAGCFCCARCNTQLQDDYFEVDGRHYCESHAIEQAGRNADGRGGLLRPMGSPEKRRSRLMMMA